MDHVFPALGRRDEVRAEFDSIEMKFAAWGCRRFVVVGAYGRVQTDGRASYRLAGCVKKCTCPRVCSKGMGW